MSDFIEAINKLFDKKMNDILIIVREWFPELSNDYHQKIASLIMLALYGKYK